MKKIYIVTNCGYRPAVAFENKERAEAVCAMCGGSVDEVQVVDATMTADELLRRVHEVAMELEDGCGCDGGESDGV